MFSCGSMVGMSIYIMPRWDHVMTCMGSCIVTMGGLHDDLIQQTIPHPLRSPLFTNLCCISNLNFLSTFAFLGGLPSWVPNRFEIRSQNLLLCSRFFGRVFLPLPSSGSGFLFDFSVGCCRKLFLGLGCVVLSLWELCTEFALRSSFFFLAS